MSATDEEVAGLAVTAFLVVQHDEHPRLQATLEALLASTRSPDRLVVIDATPGRELPALLAANPAVADAHWSVSVVTVPPGTPFAEIVDTAVTALPEPGEDAVVALRPRRRANKRLVRPRDRDQWLWLLHEDSAPAPDALERLVDVVGGSDRIGIAGCKVLDLDDPTRLIGVGVDVTRTGRHVGSRTQGEVDQGQYDDRTDVLAVSSAGMLIRRDVFLTLGGFDPAFDGDGDGLDLSWRTLLIGRQVIVVPAAGVHQDLQGARDVDRPAPRSARRLRRHRQVALARCSLLGLPFMALWILVGCSVLGVLMLLLKRPRRSLAEFAQASAPLGLVRILGARWRFVGRASTRRRNLRGVFVPWRGAVDHAMATFGDAIRLEPGYREGPDERRTGAHPAAAGDASPRGRGGVLRHPGLWLTLLLLAAAAVAWRDLITGGALRGTGEGLTGGALQPFATDAEGIWRTWRDAWNGPGLGQAAAPTPYLVLLVPFAWLAQLIPGVNDTASGAAVVAWLLVLAMPLSGLAAYRAGRVATHAAWPRAAAALAWAGMPTVGVAVAGGRLGPVVAHIVFPFAFAGAFEVGHRRATTPVLCGTVLAAAVVGAFAPPLLAVVSLVGIGVAVLGRSWARLRGLVVALAPWLLLGWWTRALFADWRAVLAAPGGTDIPRGTPAWQLVLLHPGGPGSVTVWVGVPVLVVGAAGLLRCGFGRAETGLALVALLGLAGALASGRIHLVQWADGPRTPWSGLGLEVFAAALLGAALLGLRGVYADRFVSAPAALRAAGRPVVAIACAAFAVVGGIIAWQAQPTDHLRPAAPVATGLVADQLHGPSAVRLLRLTVTRSGTIGYRLTGREPGLPVTGLHQPSVPDVPVATRTVAALDDPRSTNSPLPGLRSLAVGFVVVDGAGDTSQITGALRHVAGLTRISGGRHGTVWRVDPQAAGQAGAVPVASSRVWLVSGDRAVRAVPSRPAHARSTTTLPSGPSGRTLMLSEGAGWRTHGTVTVDGHRIAPVVRDGRLGYPVPARGGQLRIDPGIQHAGVVLGQAALAALLLYLAIPFGNRRSRRSW